MRFGSVPPRNWQKAHGTMISHEKSTNDISNIVNVIYDGILALKQVSSYKGVWSNCGIGIVPDSGPYITNLKYHLQLVFCQTSRKKHLNL
jgi:hypothetical protein